MMTIRYSASVWPPGLDVAPDSLRARHYVAVPSGHRPTREQAGEPTTAARREHAEDAA